MNKLLLISIDSLFAALPVNAYLSLPAKSTSYNLLIITFSGFLASICSIAKLSIVCDLLDELFILCEATTLFLIPKWYKAKTSSGDLHSKV